MFEKWASEYHNDPSFRSLLLSNLATLVSALVFNWNVLTLMWIYWTQSVIIGIFTVLKILTARVQPHGGIGAQHKTLFKFGTLAAKIFFTGFFIIHYGLFHFAYLIFLGAYTAITFPKDATIFSVAVDFLAIAASAVVFFAHHAFSYYYNFVRKNEREIFFRDLSRIFGFPYGRIIPMHLSIIFGGFAMFLAPPGIGNRIFLMIFLLLKIATDLHMHVEEHKPRNQRDNQKPMVLEVNG